MLLARVEGNVVATHKHPSLRGWRLAICQPIAFDGTAEGPPQVAIDPLGAGMHDTVIISSDGLATRRLLGDDRSPARWLLIGIVDEVESRSSADTRERASASEPTRAERGQGVTASERVGGSAGAKLPGR